MSRSELLVKLQRAKQAVTDAQKEIDEFVSTQHSFAASRIKHHPRYQELQAKLRTKRGVVRSIQRQLKSN
jgi:cell fate (sporulation/competence/biofilm development) regulator YlbF (YheA/YmcA/DUF963 family)